LPGEVAILAGRASGWIFSGFEYCRNRLAEAIDAA